MTSEMLATVTELPTETNKFFVIKLDNGRIISLLSESLKDTKVGSRGLVEYVSGAFRWTTVETISSVEGCSCCNCE